MVFQTFSWDTSQSPLHLNIPDSHHHWYHEHWSQELLTPSHWHPCLKELDRSKKVHLVDSTYSWQVRLPKQLSEVTKKMTRPFWRNLKKPDSFQILGNHELFTLILSHEVSFFHCPNGMKFYIISPLPACCIARWEPNKHEYIQVLHFV